MHRNGIQAEELDRALEIIEKTKLKLKGAFTHFANIFDGEESIYVQKERFDKIKNKLMNN